MSLENTGLPPSLLQQHHPPQQQPQMTQPQSAEPGVASQPLSAATGVSSSGGPNALPFWDPSAVLAPTSWGGRLAQQHSALPPSQQAGFGGSFRKGLWGDRPANPPRQEDLLQAFRDIAQDMRSHPTPASSEAHSSSAVPPSLTPTGTAPPAKTSPSAEVPLPQPIGTAPPAGVSAASTAIQASPLRAAPAVTRPSTTPQAPKVSTTAQSSPVHTPPRAAAATAASKTSPLLFTATGFVSMPQASVQGSPSQTPTRVSAASRPSTTPLSARATARGKVASPAPPSEAVKQKRLLQLIMPVECMQLTQTDAKATAPTEADTKAAGVSSEDQVSKRSRQSACTCHFRHRFKGTCALNLRWCLDSMKGEPGGSGKKQAKLKKWLRNKARSAKFRTGVSSQAAPCGCLCRHRHTKKGTCVPALMKLVEVTSERLRTPPGTPPTVAHDSAMGSPGRTRTATAWKGWQS